MTMKRKGDIITNTLFTQKVGDMREKCYKMVTVRSRLDREL